MFPSVEAFLLFLQVEINAENDYDYDLFYYTMLSIFCIVSKMRCAAGGGCASPADEPDTTQYSPEELAAIVQGGTFVKKTI